MTKRKTALLFLIVALGVSGAVLATNDASVKIKMKYGAECKIDRTCDTMFYVDCGAAVDGPAYYLDKDLEIIGTSGGLCMQGCTGAPKEWAMCDGRQSDGPNPDLLKQIDQ